MRDPRNKKNKNLFTDTELQNLERQRKKTSSKPAPGEIKAYIEKNFDPE